MTQGCSVGLELVFRFTLVLSVTAAAAAGQSIDPTVQPSASDTSVQPPSKGIRLRPLPSPSPGPSPSLEHELWKNIWRDQAFFWTLPLHLNTRDAEWLAPLAISTGVLIATDKESARGVGNNDTRIRVSRRISQLGALYTTSATAAAFYLAGRYVSDRRLRETGLLGFEATVDGLIVSQGLKAISQRPRPNEDQGRGIFFDGGRSFPSGHAVQSWAMAAIVAHEYSDSRTMQILSYGIATAVSVSRFTAKTHFLSDVLVGSAIGYGIGTYVFHKRHQETKTPPTGFPSKTSNLFVIPQYNAQTRTAGLRLGWQF